MLKVLDHLRPLIEESAFDPTVPLPQAYSGNEKETSQQDLLAAAAKELEQAWGRSLHCQLQFQTRLEMLLESAIGLQQDGGALGMRKIESCDRVFHWLKKTIWYHFYAFAFLSLL